MSHIMVFHDIPFFNCPITKSVFSDV